MTQPYQKEEPMEVLVYQKWGPDLQFSVVGLAVQVILECSHLAMESFVELDPGPSVDLVHSNYRPPHSQA